MLPRRLSGATLFVILYTIVATAYVLLFRGFLGLFGLEPWYVELLLDLRGLSLVLFTSLVLVFANRRSAKKTKLSDEQEKSHILQMAQADKMITLGQLVSGVAHEINNPINFITLNLPLIHEFWQGAKPILDGEYEEKGDFYVGRLRYSVLRSHIDKMFDGIAEGTERIKGIVSTLREFGRPDPSNMAQSVDPNDSIRKAVTLMQSSIEGATDKFLLRLDPGLPRVKGSGQKLEQVAANLIQNALQSLPSRSSAVSVSTRYEAPRRSVVIEVRDEGSGIDPELLPRITDPFFTTRRGTGGMGLGLAIVAQIVFDHGGRMDIESKVGIGTVFTITIPAETVKKGSH